MLRSIVQSNWKTSIPKCNILSSRKTGIPNVIYLVPENSQKYSLLMYSAMALIFAIWTLARVFAIFFQDLLQTS